MDPSETLILVLFNALGAFSLVAAVINMDWFFETSAAMSFVSKLGRTGARIFYGLLGIGLLICGSLGLIYW